jgi:hypothetical protein
MEVFFIELEQFSRRKNGGIYTPSQKMIVGAA